MLSIPQINKKYAKQIEPIYKETQDTGELIYFIYTRYPYVVHQECTTFLCDTVKEINDALETLEEAPHIWND